MKSYTLHERIVHIFLIVFEATQVITSVLDIGLDVLVCIEFYTRNLWGPFYSSVAVFCLAQAAYATLFVANYGQNISTVKGKVKAFFIALPVAQFIPVFSWLETFHWPIIDRLLRRLDLAPSSQPVSANEKEIWTLWSFGLQKFRANLGFLVEAIVEAVPQAIIQTYVIVTYGTADALLVVSILMSVFVVASKGYILAYSIHAQSFIFNTIAVFADICGLFATIVWVFAGCSSDSLSSPEPSQLYLIWWNLAVAVSGLMSVGLLFLSMCASADDHLKVLLYRKDRWPYYVRLYTANAVFEIWIIRFLLWTVFLIPDVVLVLGTKFTLFPVLHIRSVHPSHYSFPKVNRRMFQYIYGGGKDQVTSRLEALNRILHLAATSAEMNSLHAERTYRSAAVRQDLRSFQDLKEYVKEFSRRKYKQLGTNEATTRVNEVGSSQQNLVADALAAEGDHLQYRRWRKFMRRTQRSMFEKRSVIFWFAIGADSSFVNDMSLRTNHNEDSFSDSDESEEDSISNIPARRRRRRRNVKQKKNTFVSEIDGKHCKRIHG